MHIFRYPNISSSSTWGGLSIGLPSDAKLRNHMYRVSFDYRGNTGGANLDVYTCYSVGWCDHAIGLPYAWNYGISSFDTDWEWNRYEFNYSVEDSKLDFIPGSNRPAWDPNTTYGTGWYAVTYNGHVYRHRNGWTAPTPGIDPETQYQAGGVWDWKIPMTSGYMDVYRNMKIGFTYNTQGNRGTHVYIDNIQLTDTTTNQRWKFNGQGWEADNLSEGTTHIFAKGTAYMGLDKGDGGDIFAVEGSRVLKVNGTTVSTPNARGLTLVVIDEATGNIDSNTNYDVHGSVSARDSLGVALSNIGSNKLWTLTSFDAIGSSSSPILEAQMASMGSVLLLDDEGEYSVYKNNSYRSTYAAVGRGQQIIKEDGSAQLDTVYKRKAVIDLRV